MLNKGQIARLLCVSFAFWLAATAYIHFLPQALTGPVRAAVGFLAALPMAWLCIVITRTFGRLSAHQLLPGVGVVGAVAMMIDGVVVRWFPGVYAADESTLRYGAAWLLWGYGVSLAVAVLMSTAAAAAESTSKRSM